MCVYYPAWGQVRQLKKREPAPLMLIPLGPDAFDHINKTIIMIIIINSITTTIISISEE